MLIFDENDILRYVVHPDDNFIVTKDGMHISIIFLSNSLL